MEKETPTELRIRLGLASPLVGTMWRHKTGTIYQITGVSIRESDGEVLYTYYSVRDFVRPPIHFTRPAAEWNIPADGDSEPRFVRLEN